MNYSDVIDFWFDEIDPKQRWRKDDGFDHQIRRRFSDVHAAAARCELYEWRQTPAGRLAEIIVLDQFSRNLYRDSALSFAYDPLALCLAQEAVSAQAAQALDPELRCFCYMPYMHSESKQIHSIALKLFTELGLQVDYELRHKEIIDRFGRYPHRNAILGRSSTSEELAFLEQSGSSF